MTLRLTVLIVIGFAMSSSAAEPIRYTVRIPRPQTHYVEVEATIPTLAGASTELMMPVWTPGSYLVREFARHVESLTARDEGGQGLKVEKVRKNRWRIEPSTRDTLKLSYKVYCREMAVRTNWVDSSFALLNGAATYLTLADGVARPHDVTIEPPSDWNRTITGLPDAADHAPHHYLAPDYDTLVDSPILAGNPTVYEFDVDGKRHFLVNEGEGGVWDGPRSARDVEAIVRQARGFWGQLPYDKYVFMNLIVEAGGGLEHKNSTVLMTSRYTCRTRKGYKGWLDLVSHEFFHTWNVKRLRPVELGPFDYENEVATRCLWIAEGLTEYYGPLLVRRANLMSREEYLTGEPSVLPPGEAGATEIAGLQATIGRKVQPLETASYDAWIKFYRPDENTRNSAISYYTKGAVVGFLLDAKIRRVTENRKSLDDVMRLAYERYSGEKGYTSAQFRQVAANVAGIDLSEWFLRALETTEELDYTEALDWYGLRFKTKEPPKDGKPPKAWLGLSTKPENGRLMVTQVRRETPGYDAGFNVGDEILALGDFRVLPDQWGDRMEQYRPGETTSILVSRRDRLVRLETRFGSEPAETWAMEALPEPSESQKSNLKAWLGD